MDFQIRKPSKRDIAGIKSIFSDWWRDSDGNIEKEEVDYWTEKVKDAIAGETGTKYLVAINNENTVCGIIGWRGNIHKILVPYAKKKAVELYDLFVLKKCKNLGIGNNLIERFLNEASKNYEEVVFVSAERWKDAWPFYDKLRFNRVGFIRSEKTGELYQIFQIDLQNK
jgi:N-acetylglutamate synthase-like GNAT family acetyltransferase